MLSRLYTSSVLAPAVAPPAPSVATLTPPTPLVAVPSDGHGEEQEQQEGGEGR